MTTTTETKIEVKLVRSNFLTRWPCHVCGGHTEKVGILAAAEDDQARCVSAEAGADAIDATREASAKRLEAEAAMTRWLIGRLALPTFQEWLDASGVAEITDPRRYEMDLTLSAVVAAQRIAAEVERDHPSVSRAARDAAIPDLIDRWGSLRAEANRDEHERVAAREVRVCVEHCIGDDGEDTDEITVEAGRDECRYFADKAEALKWAEQRAADLGFEIIVLDDEAF